MGILHVSIKYKKQANVETRIVSSIALRTLINALQKKQPIDLKNISDISCEFTTAKEDGSLTRQELEELVSKMLSKDDYEVTISEEGDATDADEARRKVAEALRHLQLSPEGKKLGENGGTADEQASADKKPASQAPEQPVKNDNLEAVMTEIRGLIGAEAFKRKAEELAVVAPKLKSAKDYFDKTSFLFAIDDGNGLSSVARLLGLLLNALGLNKKSRAVELPAVPFIDKPDTLERVKAQYLDIFNRIGDAGVVVFDLSKCYTHLNKEMYREFLADICGHSDLPVVIFRVPYLEEQVYQSVKDNLLDQFFIQAVPFVPLDMDDLYGYAKKVATNFGFSFGENLQPVFNEIIAKEKSDGRFYGFRTVEKVVHELIYDKSAKTTDNSSVISAGDIDDVDDIMAEMRVLPGMEQLKMLYGLEDVVKQVEEIITFIEYAKNDPKIAPSFHMRFVGPPGTGKTTVARIIGKILKDKGILRTGVFFEYSGNDFVGEYVGSTAPKTAQMCRDAYGGVLFIDEAYALCPGNLEKSNSGSFRQEALNTLLTEMENHRTDMLVIMAGYEEEIDELMQHNPGLTQRMPYTIRFGNYSREALANIFFSMASKRFFYEDAFVDTVKEYFKTLPNNIYHSPNFANARYVRNLYERTISKAILRASMEKIEVATLMPVDFLKAVEEMKNTATAASSYGKSGSGATMFSEERAKIKFADVCGQEEAKELLSEIVECLKNPEKFKKVGARIPKGALLYGPPGTGKTMLAKAVAGEAGVPVFTTVGSEYVSKYVGEGGEKIKQLFESARKIAPSIIFIDEIDAMGMSRTSGNNNAALQRLLTEMDGFDDEKTVIVLAATNQPDALDAALKRPGRFDREIPVELPDLDGRIAILQHYLNRVQHEENVDLQEVGHMTTGFSGADLGNIVNEAALRALRENRSAVTTADLTESVEVVAVGHVKKGRVLSEQEKWVVCYHEIGHALLSALQTNTAPVKKITVVPRTGGTLGYVMHADAEEKFLSTKTEMLNRIAVCVAGRAAEELQFGEVTTGASNDIQKATGIARAIVATYGMSDEFGMVCFDTHSNSYLGGSRSTQCSEDTARRIDAMVVEIVRTQYEKAMALLKADKPLLDALAQHIFQRESISGDEFMAIFRQQKGG